MQDGKQRVVRSSSPWLAAGTKVFRLKKGNFVPKSPTHRHRNLEMCTLDTLKVMISTYVTCRTLSNTDHLLLHPYIEKHFCNQMSSMFMFNGHYYHYYYICMYNNKQMDGQKWSVTRTDLDQILAHLYEDGIRARCKFSACVKAKCACTSCSLMKTDVTWIFHYQSQQHHS